MAISTQAKAFLASPVTQQVVNDIYSGRVVYSVATYRSILADNYKPRAIEIYDPLSAPFLNHYRSVTVLNIASVFVTKNLTGFVLPSIVPTLIMSTLPCC